MTKSVTDDRTETAFQDFKHAYSPEQAVVEANRCLFCSDAPCMQACPTHIDVPQFIRKIATGNLRGSARTIFDANILGMSCARVCPVETLCVGACVFNTLGVPPIQIGKLQRHATDRAFEAGTRFFEAGPPSGKSIGLVGGGPASLAAAHELRRHGHACTIYEKRSVLGGLNTTGIAPYKMRADRSVLEADWVLAIGGIEVKTGVEVGQAPTFAALERAHDAVFVGVGLGPDTSLRVPGEDLAGVAGAVAFIERLKLGRVSLAGVRRALVVGGGNTALDGVRELCGLGVPEVTLVYRGKEAKMPGYRHEWSAAKQEGARALFQHLPVAFEGAGKVERARLVRMDDQKKPIAGTEHTVEADLVLVAIGQSTLGALLAGLDGIRIVDGCVAVDADGFTGRKGWYAGGDCTNGGKEVVNAAAEGKAAALAIHRYLTGGAHA
ncbi:MAG: FAD-dependent oxidoreductase [Polyangiaceae bacterium]|nr:FAD-dependent oxidoreductase [Polyangiaceae bacterium]